MNQSWETRGKAPNERAYPLKLMTVCKFGFKSVGKKCVHNYEILQQVFFNALK